MRDESSKLGLTFPVNSLGIITVIIIIDDIFLHPIIITISIIIIIIKIVIKISLYY